ncbi:MAG: 23S rRNA (guanosine(2251)-2'-O)-methyltransferase RlmB [Rhodobiaceae bacterium]|nr:23S rRNA (guanosine(2251)-2'-O)-methyltransferase RlmB [Rhodobiaceae bacterium]|tara:strand:+ start:600 stop:1328 length:729 start_codon:yes stop_codon:yes gene_type:complete
MNNYVYLYGHHAATHALLNKDRVIKEIFITKNAHKKIAENNNIDINKFNTKIVESKVINGMLNSHQVHQGILVVSEKKKIITINDYDFSNSKRVIFLDNVIDPRNVGAIIRTCTAFNCKTIITTNKFDQLDEGIIAKASSGGLEYTDIITSNNLSNCLNELKKNKFWIIGFDSEAVSNIEDSVFNLQDQIVLIFGEEGKGMRNLTKKLCDVTYRINTIGEIKSLNVSVAIGIILDKITPNFG